MKSADVALMVPRPLQARALPAGVLPRSCSRGFTLVEVVVAVALFALAMGLAYGGLDAVVRARAQLDQQAQQLGQLQFAVGLLETDLRSLLARPVRDELGREQPPLRVAGGELALTRAGYGNGLAQPRSELQRVEWFRDAESLHRRALLSLDRAPRADRDDAPAVLEGVERFEIELLAENGRWLRQWPAPGQPAARLPRAVRLQLTVPQYGDIERIFELPEAPR